MPRAISLLMGTCALPDCHRWQPPSADHWSAIAPTDASSSHYWTHSKGMSKMEDWQHRKGIKHPLLHSCKDLQQKQKSWPATKWRSEIKISKWKYVVTNDKQWLWATSINIIVQWNHNKIIYQCWNWSNWAKLINQNVMWSAITQWSTIAEKQVMITMKCSPPRSPKKEKGGLSTRKLKGKNIVNG